MTKEYLMRTYLAEALQAMRHIDTCMGKIEELSNTTLDGTLDALNDLLPPHDEPIVVGAAEMTQFLEATTNES